MPDSFLDDARGFTPVPDNLVNKYDFPTAYVWGIVWRYCQMEKGKCTASHETIAERAGMCRRSLISKLETLIKDGYIEDLTPGLKNKPHTYCAKIGEAKIKAAVQNLPSESAKTAQQDDNAMQNLHSESAEFAQSDDNAMQNLHSEEGHYAKFTQPTMQNLHLKKDSEETNQESLLREREREQPASPPDPPPPSEVEGTRNKDSPPPAAETYWRITRRYPAKEIYPLLVDIDDLERWERVIRAWIGCGYKPANVMGMKDYYNRGEIPGLNGAKPNGKFSATSKNYQRAGREPAEGRDRFSDPEQGEPWDPYAEPG